MNATELRIGNYTFDQFGKIFQIKEIHYNKRIRRFPIPITEEWLIKFGFDGWDKDGYTLILSNGNFFQLGFDLPLVTNIKYVHTLQNLYFALTNKELTIK